MREAKDAFNPLGLYKNSERDQLPVNYALPFLISFATFGGGKESFEEEGENEYGVDPNIPPCRRHVADRAGVEVVGKPETLSEEKRDQCGTPPHRSETSPPFGPRVVQ